MERSEMPTDDALVHHLDEKPVHIATAFRCARSGIVYAFSTQRNFKIHTVFAILAILLGVILGIDASSWVAIVLCIALVFALELMNTAIEAVVDLVSPEWNLFAKRAKDCAAGSVYVVAAASLVVAAFVYIPPIVGLISDSVQG